MNTIGLLSHKSSHIPQVLHDLISCGWSIASAPADRRIPRNGLKIILRADEVELRLRLFVYKVTSSSRNRAHERRVEITSTYRGKLKHLNGFGDVVLAIDIPTAKYVGIDNRRLELGGRTHNASSFFDLEGLSVPAGEFLINPRRAKDLIFPAGIELHSFFDASRLSEYLFNHREVHAGSYAYGGAFSGPIKRSKVSLPLAVTADKLVGSTFVLVSKTKKRSQPVASKLIEAVEADDYSDLRRRKITPEQLKQLLVVCDEVGALGEQAVLVFERKRLKRLGFATQAAKVARVSLQSIGEGYDIISFEDDGVTPRYLEVKSTVGRGAVVDISRGEWRAAKRLRKRYSLVRVTDTKTLPTLHFVRDPFTLEEAGLVTKTEAGWKLDLSGAMQPTRKTITKK